MMRPHGPPDTQALACLWMLSLWFSASLGLFRAVLGAALLALGHAGGIQRAAHGVVAHARQVLDATAADEHDRVLLQVVAFAADVADDLETVGQAHLGDLAQGRIRLLRRRGVHARAHAATLRAVGQRRRGALVSLRAARLAHQLIDCRHEESWFKTKKQAGVHSGLSTLYVWRRRLRASARTAQSPLANTRSVLPLISVLRQNRGPKANPGQREAEL